VTVVRRSPQPDLMTAGARPPERIVVGVDFSEGSLAAAQWVARHLGRDATLTLVHVVAPPRMPNVPTLRSGQMAEPQSRLQARMESMSGALHGLARVIGRASTEVEVRVGDPVIQLPAYAKLVDADLLVVGGNAAFHAAPRRETATTDRLLRQLACPGLVVRNIQSAVSTVLVAVADDTAASVLAVARMVASPSSAPVVTLRLAETGPATKASALATRRDGVVNAEQVRMIHDVARVVRANVIVIGSQSSATDVDDNVARLVARTSDCAVLVVPQCAGPGLRWADSSRPLVGVSSGLDGPAH